MQRFSLPQPGRSRLRTALNVTSIPNGASSSRVLFAAGGTGGHIFPAVAIADELRRLDPEAQVLFAGSQQRLEWKAVPKAGYRIEEVPAVSLRRPLWYPSNLLVPFKLLLALLKAIKIVWDFKPQVVIGTGGYVSFPTCLAGWLLGKRVVIQEQNAYIGIANAVLARIASRIFLAFEAAVPKVAAAIGSDSAQKKCRVVGNPIRSSIVDSASRVRAENAARDQGEPSTSSPSSSQGALRLLILGGSLGAKRLNEVVLASLPALLARFPALSVHWQTGGAYLDALSSSPGLRALEPSLRSRVEITPFIEDMGRAYGAASLVVSRAGAITCSELLATGTRALLVPSPNVAEDHQTRNAEAMHAMGAADWVGEGDLTPDALLGKLEDMFSSRGNGQRQAREGTSDAARTIALEVLSMRL